MRPKKKTVFERCPLCHTGAVETTEERSVLTGILVLRPCSTCGAVFADGGRGRFRLRYCDPRALAAQRGKPYPASACADCALPVQCLLGKNLARAEWEKIARGEPLDTSGAQDKARLESGSLPVCPAETVPVGLEPGEIAHRVAPVYLSEQHARVDPGDLCRLVLTDRRIILIHESGSFEISLGDVESLEETTPGFAIHLKDAIQPIQCYPLPGDLIYSAIEGALRNFHGGAQKAP
ncbi:MAG: hypothetical protein HY675_06385 [Chloroflexi bacterium]|nr:hypothetical protein [Chloroflexota bacterium]